MIASARAADLRTAFLRDAAKLMATTSPSTASYLASESIQVELAHGQPSKPFEDHQRQTFCTACGNVFIPGWNCSTVRGEKRKGPAPNTGKHVGRATMVYHCQACHYHTTFCIPSLTRPDNIIHKKHISGKTSIAVEGAHHKLSREPTAVATKTSSKKRAKVRKDRAGLRSLLNSNKEEKDRTNPAQLSLMDLMMP